MPHLKRFTTVYFMKYEYGCQLFNSGVALYCTCTAAWLSLWCLSTQFTLPYYFHRTFNNYTGGQSVSFVLLWQPSDGTDLFVIDYILCYSQNINMMMIMVMLNIAFRKHSEAFETLFDILCSHYWKFIAEYVRENTFKNRPVSSIRDKSCEVLSLGGLLFMGHPVCFPGSDAEPRGDQQMTSAVYEKISSHAGNSAELCYTSLVRRTAGIIIVSAYRYIAITNLSIIAVFVEYLRQFLINFNQIYRHSSVPKTRLRTFFSAF